VLSNERAHVDVVTDLQLSADWSDFITSSKDKTARIHDAKTLTALRTFSTEMPLNSAALTPNVPYVRFPSPSAPCKVCSTWGEKVLLGGGQEVMSVTTTSLRQGKFEARFWHCVFEEEVGRAKGHFGSLNTYVDKRFSLPSPRLIVENQNRCTPCRDGLRLGGEDCFVRLHYFDESYFKARPYGNSEILN
jgi:translation initiation factor 3 subunit I